MAFPIAPGYRFSWRSLMVQPIEGSEELITIGAIVQEPGGQAKDLLLIPLKQLKAVFGESAGPYILEAFDLIAKDACRHYEANSLEADWTPALSGFVLGSLCRGRAEDEVQAISLIECSSSSIALGMHREDEGTALPPLSKRWRKEVKEAVARISNEHEQYLYKQVALTQTQRRTPVEFGFLSATYAAQFALLAPKRVKLRDWFQKAQGLMWQLDQLREVERTVPRDNVELLVLNPESSLETEASDDGREDFIHELQIEGERREISIQTLPSSTAIAQHVVAKAAA